MQPASALVSERVLVSKRMPAGCPTIIAAKKVRGQQMKDVQ
jgi:hypothetical protein